MRARFSRVLGLPVQESESGGVLGTIGGIVLHPDTGVVEAFTVRVSAGMFAHRDLLLLPMDILHWGLRMTVRDGDVLALPEDIVRLQPLLTGNRPVLGQRMVTESGRALGRCSDLQFSTRDFRLEWLFPKRLLRWGIPVPASQILEVRSDAIIVRDAAVPEKKDAMEGLNILPQVPEAA